MSATVKVKHGKTTYKDVEILLDEPVEVLQAQLYTLTNVPPERQKISYRGKMIKDDADLSKIGLRKGAVLMLIGAADQLKAPEQAIVIRDDMSLDAAMIIESAGNPGGLVNLGNTCYMNSTLQCLRSIPEFKDSLVRYDGVMSQADPVNNLVVSLKEVVNNLENHEESYPPVVFIQLFRALYPQFAEQSERGGFAQQDAEEAWGQLARSLGEKLRHEGKNLMDLLFGIELESVLSCSETDAEPSQTSTEKLLHLSCHIGASTSHMHEGIRDSFAGSIEKNSAVLGRNAVYSKISKIKRLPKYLVVQFVRFYWKRGEGENAGQKSKILKVVHFPDRFDVTDMCTDELQAKIRKNKVAWLAAEDRRLGIKSVEEMVDEGEGSGTKDKGNDEEMKQEEPTTDGDADGDIATKMEVDEEEASKTKKQKQKPDLKGKGKDAIDVSADSDFGLHDNTTGVYEVQGVLTHMGRSANGGHYISWIRDAEDKDKFNVYDDEKVESVPATDIKKLEGGADWHIAYMVVYKSRSF